MIYPAPIKLQCTVLAAFILSACAATPLSPKSSYLVASANFENAGYKAGEPYDLARQSMDWDVRGKPSRMNADTAIITDYVSHNGSRSLQITYASNVQDVKQASWALPPAKHYTLSYAVRFEDGFTFNGQGKDGNGGKLPGLAGRGTNGYLCAGGMDCADGGGFTARLMWRTDGEAVLYLYDHTKSMAGRKYGEDIAFKNNTHFVPGHWHHITQTVQMNTAGKADGRIDIWMDGQKVVSLVDRELAAQDESIDTVLFSTFFGGNSMKWFPASPQTAHFDDFVVKR